MIGVECKGTRHIDQGPLSNTDPGGGSRILG